MGEGELAYWVEFWHLEPFGLEWLRDAETWATITNMAGKYCEKRIDARDLMPRFRPKPPTDPAILEKQFLFAMRALGKRIEVEPPK